MLDIAGAEGLGLGFGVHIHVAQVVSDPTGTLGGTFVWTRAYLELASALTWRVINATIEMILILKGLLRGSCREKTH